MNHRVESQVQRHNHYTTRPHKRQPNPNTGADICDGCFRGEGVRGANVRHGYASIMPACRRASVTTEVHVVGIESWQAAPCSREVHAVSPIEGSLTVVRENLAQTDSELLCSRGASFPGALAAALYPEKNNLLHAVPTDSNRPHRCCHLTNNFGSRRIFHILHNWRGDIRAPEYMVTWSLGPRESTPQTGSRLVRSFEHR